MEIKLDGLIALGVIILVVFLIYSKVKNKSLKETFEEVKELFVGIKKPGEN